MATGTVFSRASGFVRAALLVAALGAFTRGDLFTIANTLPNMVYILLAGGIFNAVLVPQLVRRIKDDPDGGDAYASRMITLSALFLGTVTAVLVVAAPWLLRLYLSSRYLEADRVTQLESIVDLTRWCLPQVFFYGMYVLVGQVLNARGRFGPMMWAPIANNVIAVAMLVVYLLVWGRATGAEQLAALDTSQEVLLGLGSTLGIAAQCLVLVPYLRASGFTYRPRFDFRDPELRKTLSLGIWTVLFVIATQTAYFVVVKLASDGGAEGGTRLHRLLHQPADHDGAALHRHRVARDGDPAAALHVRRTRTGSPSSAAPSARPWVRRWRWCCPSPCSCRSWPTTSPAAAFAWGDRDPAQPSLRPSRSSVRRWSPSPSTTSCCAASMPSRRPGGSSTSSSRSR